MGYVLGLKKPSFDGVLNLTLYGWSPVKRDSHHSICSFFTKNGGAMDRGRTGDLYFGKVTF